MFGNGQRPDNKRGGAFAGVKEQEDSIESTLLNVMYDMIDMGVVGTQEVFNFRDTLVVEDLTKNGIKVWIVSKDDEIT